MTMRPIWDPARGLSGYRGSPAEREDREEGLVVGGQCWWRVEPKDKLATIISIEIDAEGDPWFTLQFEGDHKPIRAERDDIAPMRR